MNEDLIIVVPGILGSVLKKGGRRVWDTSPAVAGAALWNHDRILNALRLPPGVKDEAPDERHRLTPAGLLGGWHIWPGVWAGAGYHDFVARLRRKYPEPGQVAEFAYDWRLSNRYSAQRLAGFVEDTLGPWREHPARRDAKVVFVCHSMGGLVTRHYLDFLRGAEVARRLITIGTPYAGSMDAVRALSKDLKLVPQSLLEVAATFPSLRQLLPTYRCVRTESGRVAIDQIGLPAISREMMADARALQAPTRTAARPYPIHVFGGDRQKTWATAQLVGGSVRYFHDWPDNDPLGGDPRLVGDGRVARAAAVPEDWPDDSGGQFEAGRHSGLPTELRIFDHVLKKLDAIDRGARLAAELDITLDLPETALAGQPVRVAALGSDPGVAFRIRASRPGEPRPARGLPTRWDEERGEHVAELDLPPGDWIVEAEAMVGDPPSRMSDILTVFDPGEIAV